VSLLAPKVAAAKAVGVLARRAGRGGGTSLPGKVLTRLEPHAIGLLAGRLEHGNVVISATNGKTTTAAMVASILERSGARLVHNRAGANMAGGVASALAALAPRRARARRRLGLFEVDEFWLGAVVEELEPRAMLLGNLFRDQLDRYGELETIADRWAAWSPARRDRLVLNADDPLVADLGRERGAVYFGVEDDSLALPSSSTRRTPSTAAAAATPTSTTAVYLGHLGRYHCPNCGRRRPSPRVAADVAAARHPLAAFTLRAPGARRAAAARALQRLQRARRRRAAPALGVELRRSSPACGASSPPSGAPRRSTRGRPTSILLVKNPAGANEVLRTLALEGGELDLLGVLNDRIADGRDVSWVWDADWELLARTCGA
jgi:UDP-N-acetylmuramyl tripeptide synthase